MIRAEIEKVVEPIIRDCLRQFGDYSRPGMSPEEFAVATAGELRPDVRRVSLLVSLVQSATGSRIEGEGLELGCGYGFLLFPLALFNPKVHWTGVEHPDRNYFSRQEFQQTIRQYNSCLVGVNFVRERLPFRDQHFSVITLSETLEHLPMERIDFVMEEIKRVSGAGRAIDRIFAQSGFTGKPDPPVEGKKYSRTSRSNGGRQRYFRSHSDLHTGRDDANDVRSRILARVVHAGIQQLGVSREIVEIAAAAVVPIVRKGGAAIRFSARIWRHLVHGVPQELSLMLLPDAQYGTHHQVANQLITCVDREELHALLHEKHPCELYGRDETQPDMESDQQSVVDRLAHASRERTKPG